MIVPDIVAFMPMPGIEEVVMLSPAFMFPLAVVTLTGTLPARAIGFL